MLPWSGVNVVYLKGVVNGPDEGEGWYVLKMKKDRSGTSFLSFQLWSYFINRFCNPSIIF